LLLYVVYTCQKSFNFINAFACYKQKCKLAPFHLAHPVFFSYSYVTILYGFRDKTLTSSQPNANKLEFLGCPTVKIA